MIQRVVAEALKGVTLRRIVDLGCGAGDGGELLRPHTAYLIGIDSDPDALRIAQSRGFYDELHLADMREYPLGDADSVTLFDSLEHVSKDDGYALLEKCRARYTMLTTPWWSIAPGFISNPEHKCLWSEEELRRLGFQTASYSFMPDVGMWFTYGGIIIGVRGNGSCSYCR